MSKTTATYAARTPQVVQSCLSWLRSLKVAKPMAINRRHLTLCSWVGRNLTINGDMWVDEFGLRIDGHVVGNVHAEHGLVMVGEGGSVMGSIRAARIIVAGKVVGNLIASDMVECSTTAQVQGHVHAAGLLIHAGAVVRGTMAVIGAKPAIAPAQAPANDDKHGAVGQRAVG